MAERSRTFTDVAAVQAGAGVKTRFALVQMTMQRARQIVNGAPPHAEANGNEVAVALEEIRDGSVRVTPRAKPPVR